MQPTDNVNIIAEKIKVWCETRERIELNLENEIEHSGAGCTDSDPPDEIISEFLEALQENIIGLGLSSALPPPETGDDLQTDSASDRP